MKSDGGTRKSAPRDRRKPESMRARRAGGRGAAVGASHTETRGARKSPTNVRAWLARRPRYRVRYTPTYASWLNQVERWFGIITQQAIRRGSFTSVPQLRKNINAFVENYNRNRRPFAWTDTADSILAKVERIGLFISGTSH